jgi:lysophospholipase L1-like esterase
MNRNVYSLVCLTILGVLTASTRAQDISIKGNQFANQYANGFSISNVGNVVDDKPDDAIFPDNIAQGQANVQNVSITAGSYQANGAFDQKTFDAIHAVRIWTLCTPGQQERTPAELRIGYTTAANVAWNNWYTTASRSVWFLPTRITTINGKPAKPAADGFVTLYDGTTNSFTGAMPGTKYTYVDVGVEIPAKATSVFFEFGPRGKTNQDATGRTFGDNIAEIQAVAATDAAPAAATAQPDNIIVKSGQSVAFLGDSITALGWETPLGYVRLVAMGLAANGVDTAPLPAGISGNTSGDMLNRFDNDVVSKKPDWVTISCGVNDVWHNPGGVPLDQYEKNITQIVDKAQAAGIKVVILTSTMIGEDAPNGFTQRQIPYNDFLRKLAKDRHYPLADLNADMQAEVADRIKGGWKPGHLLTIDGVHPNPRGMVMMAHGVLRAFGLTDAQMAQGDNAWLDMPDGWASDLDYRIRVNESFTLRQYLAAQDKIARGTDTTVQDYLQPIYNQDVEQALFGADADGLNKLQRKLQEKLDADVKAKLQQ